MPITIRVGEGVRAAVTWTNTGTETHAFDLAFLINIHDEVWVLSYEEDVTANPDQTQTTNLDTPAFTRDVIGTWDIVIIVCELTITPEGMIIDYIYDYYPDTITVTE